MHCLEHILLVTSVAVEKGQITQPEIARVLMKLASASGDYAPVADADEALTGMNAEWHRRFGHLMTSKQESIQQWLQTTLANSHPRKSARAHNWLGYKIADYFRKDIGIATDRLWVQTTIRTWMESGWIKEVEMLTDRNRKTIGYEPGPYLGHLGIVRFGVGGIAALRGDKNA